MFTGIVQRQAVVISNLIKENLSRLVISVDDIFVIKLELGASIAINGVCLTVVAFDTNTLSNSDNKATISFDVIKETLVTANLANLTAGDLVNCERSLAIGDELGGHIVSGHVYCQAKLVDKIQSVTNCTLDFSCEERWHKYILPKGFITINGISLTVGELSSQGFNVHLIPETLQRTNLSKITINDLVNLEFDQQTITIVTTLERMQLSVN